MWYECSEVVILYLVSPEVVDVTLEHSLAAHIDGDIVDGAGKHGVSAPGPAHVRGGGGVVVAGGGPGLCAPPRHWMLRRAWTRGLRHAQERLIRENVLSLPQVIWNSQHPLYQALD